MANPKLVTSKFISFDKDLKILGEGIMSTATYVYHVNQEYFIKGSPNKDQKDKMIASL